LEAEVFIVGIDLAQARDYTAITVLQREERLIPHRRPEHAYQVRHLERLPLGTPYPAQVARVKELMGQLKGAALVVDQTGVGRPVVDMLRAVQLVPTAVTITGGDSVSRDGYDYRVPKRDLVSVVQVLLQSERLKIASSLKEASTLTSELLAFKVSVSLKGHDSYGNDAGPWRENPHDDLVLAVALACWYGENMPVQPPHIPSWSGSGVRW
jgi:hypothetical protein